MPTTFKTCHKEYTTKACRLGRPDTSVIVMMPVGGDDDAGNKDDDIGGGDGGDDRDNTNKPTKLIEFDQFPNLRCIFNGSFK